MLDLHIVWTGKVFGLAMAPSKTFRLIRHGLLYLRATECARAKARWRVDPVATFKALHSSLMSLWLTVGCVQSWVLGVSETRCFIHIFLGMYHWYICRMWISFWPVNGACHDKFYVSVFLFFRWRVILAAKCRFCSSFPAILPSLITWWSCSLMLCFTHRETSVRDDLESGKLLCSPSRWK